MSDPSSHELLVSLSNFRAIEHACRELHVPVADVEQELKRVSLPIESYPPEALRAFLSRLISERHLREAALETGMSHAAVLRLQESMSGHEVGARLRDAFPISKETFIRQHDVLAQGVLFNLSDEYSSVAKTTAVTSRDDFDDDGYPFR